MRNRQWPALIIIVLVTVLATWLALPGDRWDVADIREDHPIRQGLDLQGGLQVVMQANPPEGVTVDGDMMNGLRDTIERRVNGLGVSEPLIQTRGNNQIIVELPGLTDVDQAIEVIRTTALLEIIDPQGSYIPINAFVNTTLGSADEALAALTPTAIPGEEVAPATPPTSASPIAGAANASPMASPEASPVATPLVESTPDAAANTGPVYTTIISGSDLADAFVTTNQLGQMVVGFRLTSEAADRFWDYTSTNIGRPMSILIDKQVISSPVINAAISNEGTIEGIPANEVQDMVVQLQAGALAVPLDVVQSRTVGPTLGQDSIDRSLIAGVVGLGSVVLFMILFYRLPGVISVIPPTNKLQ